MDEFKVAAKKFNVLDHAPLGMFLIKNDYRVVFWNRCMEDWTGISSADIIGTDLCLRFPHLKDPTYITRLNMVFSDGPPAVFSSQLHGNIIPSRLPGGLLRIQHTTVTAVPGVKGDDFYALFAIKDVTDLARRVLEYNRLNQKATDEIRQREQAERNLKAAEEQLQIRQRMEDLGSLAGGLAHDFNNLFAGIMGNMELLNLDRASFTERQCRYIDRTVQGLARGADLVRQIQSLSKEGVSGKEKIDINDCIIYALDRLEDPGNIVIRKENRVAPATFFVMANREDMERVFHGVIENAIDAIYEKNGGSSPFINVTAEPYQSVENDVTGLAAGFYAHVVLEDSGCGMPESIRVRAFDPLFSGKEKGIKKGQGLGLAMVYNIVLSHGGYVRLDSSEGGGTVCHIYLPLVEAVSSAGTDRGKGTILVVEDDQMLSCLAKAILERMGFYVLQAYDGKEGFEIFNSHKESFVMVILDLNIPKLSGSELLEMMLSSDPDTRVIILTGEVGIDAGVGGFGGAKYVLRKPYQIKDLQNAVLSVIE